MLAVGAEGLDVLERAGERLQVTRARAVGSLAERRARPEARRGQKRTTTGRRATATASRTVFWATPYPQKGSRWVDAIAIHGS